MQLVPFAPSVPPGAAPPHRRASRAAARLALALAGWCGMAATAAACQIEPTPWGPRLTGCNLAQFFPELELEIGRDPTPAHRPLANLRIANASFQVQANDIDLLVEVLNLSPIWSAGATSIGTVATAHEVGTTRQLGSPFAFRTPLAALPRATTRWERLGRFTLPDRKRDWDICLSSTIDPPTRASAVGAVMETDETDNSYGECCRLYAPTTLQPAPGAPGAC